MITIRLMADSKSSKAPKSGGGCLSLLVVLVLLVGALGLATAVFFIIQPQDLTEIGGNSPAIKGGPERDLKAVLKNSIERGYPLALSEAEINRWLARTLTLKQGGSLAGNISLEHVWVRLEDDRAEVIMERAIMGRPFTVSMYLQIERMIGPQGTTTDVQMHGGPFHPSIPGPPQGGRFGKLVVPQGFLYLVLPAYQKLAALFPDEIDLALRQMADVKIKKGRLVLNPRDASAGKGTTLTF